MDCIAATAAMIPPGRMNPVLQIFPNLVERMQCAPRYLLDRSAIQASIEIGLGRPTVLRAALDHLRIPYPAIWIEWQESDRETLRARIGEEFTDPSRPLPVRLGCFVEADTGGRRGQVTWAWTSPSSDPVPNIAPISAYFDLDADIEQPPERVEAFKRANLSRLWADNPLQLDALMSIWRTAQHCPSPWGMRYLDTIQASGGRAADVLALAYSDVYGEYLGFLTVMLLLTASRPTVDYRPVDRSKLNRIRARRHEPQLLDHTEVVMRVADHPAGAGGPRPPLGYQRKSPRIHLVGRYLARRGTRHWLVEPYVRGSGRPVERHVHVR